MARWALFLFQIFGLTLNVSLYHLSVPTQCTGLFVSIEAVFCAIACLATCKNSGALVVRRVLYICLASGIVAIVMYPFAYRFWKVDPIPLTLIIIFILLPCVCLPYLLAVSHRLSYQSIWPYCCTVWVEAR